MKCTVPDVSVILKWELPAGNEPFQAQALRNVFASGKVKLNVPPLWYFEVGHTLSTKLPHSAERLLSLLRSSLAGIEISSTHETVAETFRLTRCYPVTFYDASYHALVFVQGGTFLTSDEKYLRAVEGEPACRHLRDWA